eukprot:1933345-Amphidinium_carterae.1
MEEVLFGALGLKTGNVRIGGATQKNRWKYPLAWDVERKPKPLHAPLAHALCEIGNMLHSSNLRLLGTWSTKKVHEQVWLQHREGRSDARDSVMLLTFSFLTLCIAQRQALLHVCMPKCCRATTAFELPCITSHPRKRRRTQLRRLRSASCVIAQCESHVETARLQGTFHKQLLFDSGARVSTVCVCAKDWEEAEQAAPCNASSLTRHKRVLTVRAHEH